MFKKIFYTAYPPAKPTMVWDGKCGFCKFWIIHWKFRTMDAVNYVTFQERSTEFPDIPLEEFKKASRFIETDGMVYAGPDSAYKSLGYYQKSVNFLHKWYQNSRFFRWISDHGYNFIAKNRPLMYRLTVFAFGKNPVRLKPYWLIWLLWILVMGVTAIIHL